MFSGTTQNSCKSAGVIVWEQMSVPALSQLYVFAVRWKRGQEERTAYGLVTTEAADSLNVEGRAGLSLSLSRMKRSGYGSSSCGGSKKDAC